MIFPAHRLMCVSRRASGAVFIIRPGPPLPGCLRMRVVASVLRRSLIREGLVVTDVVFVEIVTRGSANDWGRHAQIADERGYGDVKDIVTKAPPIGPATGDNSADVKRMTRDLTRSAHRHRRCLGARSHHHLDLSDGESRCPPDAPRRSRDPP